VFFFFALGLSFFSVFLCFFGFFSFCIRVIFEQEVVKGSGAASFPWMFSL